MAVKSKKITVIKSIMVQLNNFILEANTNYAESSREAVGHFVKYLENKRVVDLGCGDGAATPFFTDAGVKVIGVDINEYKLSLNPTKTIVNDIVSYLQSQPNNSIPNIFCHHVLEHLPNPKTALKLISDKLAKGGFVYIEVPADDHIHSVHHSTFDGPDDILPQGLETVEKITTDAHYVIAKKL